MSKLSQLERRSALTLACVISLRLFGLFLIMPVFSLYAQQMPDATPLMTGLALGVARRRAEEFSFALAVILTPAVVAKEALRLIKHQGQAGDHAALTAMIGPGLLGMVLSFGAGLLALRWLSRWLEHGKWYLFGGYCLCASVVVLLIG